MIEDKDSIENPIDQEHLERFRSAAGEGPVLISAHDSPDPDALASGRALAQLLLEVWGIESKLIYSGLVARAENRAMLSKLVPEWENCEEIYEVQKYSGVILVDSQPGAGNNSLPEGYVPQIVIDHHHPLRDALEEVTYSDVRPDVGSTVSMVYQYLETAGVVPDSVLATAMFYGLQTDTNGLARGATPTDERVYMKLLSWLDRGKLNEVVQAGLPRVYFRAFYKGLHAASLHGSCVVANLGKMHRSDLAAELADILIRLKNSQAVLCQGIYDGFLNISLRVTPTVQDAGLLIQKVIVPPGRAGGHGTIAGGQVPLDGSAHEVVENEVVNRFLRAMGESQEGERLVSD